MKKIQLWSVDRTEGKLSATAVESVDNTKTEQDLEELLVASPDLLMDGLTLIGRQVSTDGGPLDLLGIDADGRLVVFELKRGTLTRDAVAQVLDYASDLAALDAVRFGALIEKHSGRGVDRIEDFADWYRQEHPGESEFPLDRPRMVLVGLGVDDRARRVVNFLAESQVDIQLMTFHAFREAGKLFLARQIESASPKAVTRWRAGHKGEQSQSPARHREEPRGRRTPDTDRSVHRGTHRRILLARQAGVFLLAAGDDGFRHADASHLRGVVRLTQEAGLIGASVYAAGGKGRSGRGRRVLSSSSPCRQKQEQQLRDRTPLRQERLGFA